MHGGTSQRCANIQCAYAVLVISFQVYKYAASGYQARQSQLKRLSCLRLCKHTDHSLRQRKQAKMSRLRPNDLCEKCLFSGRRTNERKGAFVNVNRRRPTRAKIEKGKREAARQARKLEFLISPTELYSHFVGNKLKSEPL